MGLHPSLKDAKSLAAKRAVLKRGERIKWLMDKNQWHDNRSALGLPKIKVVKLKVAKKEKKEEKPEGEKQEQASAEKTTKEK